MSSQATTSERAPAAWRALWGVVSPKILGIIGLLAVVCLYTALASDNFLKVGNLENIVHRTALFGILSIGEDTPGEPCGLEGYGGPISGGLSCSLRAQGQGSACADQRGAKSQPHGAAHAS